MTSDNAGKRARDANDLLREVGPKRLREAFDKDQGDRKASPQFEIPAPFAPVDPTTLPPRQWLYGRDYLRGVLTLTIAPGGVGKSSLCVAEAVAMASGREILDQTVPRGFLRVLYFNLEDDEVELARRANAVCLKHRITEADLGERLFLMSGIRQNFRLATRGQGNKAIALDEELFETVKSELTRRQVDVAIVDPFIGAHELDENDNGAIDKLAKRLVRLAVEARCAIGLVHHTRKSGNGVHQHDAESARGASALVAAARIVRVLNAMTVEQGEKAGLKEGRNNRIFRVTLDKQNLAEADAGGRWYEMISVPLLNGTPPFQTDCDYVGVPVSWTWPTSNLNTVDPEIILAVQSVIDGKDFPSNPQAHGWAGYAIAPILGLPLTPNAKGKGAPEGFRPVEAHIRAWIAGGYLVEVEANDTRTGRARKVLRAGGRVPPHPDKESEGECGSVD